jgi:hypothetical protein
MNTNEWKEFLAKGNWSAWGGYQDFLVAHDNGDYKEVWSDAFDAFKSGGVPEEEARQHADVVHQDWQEWCAGI